MLALTNNKHWLEQQSELRPDSTAIITNKNTISFKELFKDAIEFAIRIKSYGINENDNVGVLFKHGYEFFIAINALWFINAVPVLLNPNDNEEEIDHKISKTKINFIIIDDSFHNRLVGNEELVKVRYARNNIYNSQHSILFTHHSSFNINNSALILFTSGSSGKPKAVVHTFNSICESVKATDSFSELSSKDKWLSSLPQYHIGGFMILARALLTGAACAFPLSLKHEYIEKAINKFQPTHISIVSPTLQKFLTTNFSPLKKPKHVYLGGGHLDVELCKEAISKGWAIVKVYGSSETCSMNSALLTDDFSTKPYSVGKALGINKIKTDNYGEILIKSASLFKNYFGDDKLTSEKKIGGFYYTGDYGRIDEEGYLYIDSRREDIVVTGGENVSVLEIETLIKSNKKVKDAFVFGIEDKTWGQKLCAVVVANKHNPTELKEYLKQKTASYKIPKEYFFINEIPRTELGKVNRTILLSRLNLC